MKVLFDKGGLLEALAPAMGCVSEKSTMPSIEGFHLYANENKVVISTYDLEKGYRTSIEANVYANGSFILDAGKFFRIVKSMPESEIMLEIDAKNMAKITSGSSEFKMSALPGSEFPGMPDLGIDVKYYIAQSSLKTMIGQVYHAIAQNDARATLNGANFTISNGNLKIVSCDGNRLAIRERKSAVGVNKNAVQSADFGSDESDSQSFIIPGKTLSELQKILVNSEDEIGICIGRKHIMFKCEERVFFTRVIDGDYLDIERVLPKGNKIRVLVWRDALIDSLERASLISDEVSSMKGRSFVKCAFEDNVLKLSASATISSIYEELPIKKSGENITIGFNCKFLLDALRNTPEDELEISLFAPLTSMLITSAQKNEEDEFLFMVCPVKMRD